MKRNFPFVTKDTTKWTFFLILCMIGSAIFAYRILNIDKFATENTVPIGYYLANGIPLFFGLCGCLGFWMIIHNIKNP